MRDKKVRVLKSVTPYLLIINSFALGACFAFAMASFYNGFNGWIGLLIGSVNVPFIFLHLMMMKNE